MGLTPAEKQRAYRKRRMTEQPEKVAETGRVPDPIVPSSPPPIPANVRMQQLERDVTVLKAMARRLDQLEDAVEELRRHPPVANGVRASALGSSVLNPSTGQVRPLAEVLADLRNGKRPEPGSTEERLVAEHVKRAGPIPTEYGENDGA